MMKFSLTVILLVAQAAASFADPAAMNPHPVMVPAVAPRSWLGLKVVKPDTTITAHVPSLPQGMGFVVKLIDPGGPAEAAGLRENDLLWKLGDQMLVNEAQLATLLRLAAPGEEIVFSGFRSGKPLEVKLKLGEAPALQKFFSGEMVEAAILPGLSGGPMRVLNIAEKSASFTADDGRAVVRREGTTFKVQIHDPQDNLIFDGEVSDEASFNQMPGNWPRKIRVLCRTLEQALDGNMMPQRQPRPRVVPPSILKP